MVTLEILDGQFKGQSAELRCYFTDASGKRSAESLKHLGLIGNPTNTATFRPGAKGIAVVKDETGTDGKVRPKVKWINAMKAADDDVAAKHTNAAARFFGGSEAPSREPGSDDDEPPPIGDEY
jgi:hypothetical protein